MLRTILDRLLTTIPSLVGVVVVTFLLTRVLPGDTGRLFRRPRRDHRRRSSKSAGMLGLDRPLPEQFGRYVADLAQRRSRPVADDRAAGRRRHRGAAARLGRADAPRPDRSRCSIALPLGILAAVRQGSWIDHACRIVATAGVSLPVFFTGLLLVYVFYYMLGWSPAPLGRLDVFLQRPAAR